MSVSVAKACRLGSGVWGAGCPQRSRYLASQPFTVAKSREYVSSWSS